MDLINVELAGVLPLAYRASAEPLHLILTPFKDIYDICIALFQYYCTLQEYDS